MPARDPTNDAPHDIGAGRNESIVGNFTVVGTAGVHGATTVHSLVDDGAFTALGTSGMAAVTLSGALSVAGTAGMQAAQVASLVDLGALTALGTTGLASKISKELFVIDNSSDDGSVEVIKEKFASVKLIENKVNVGFGSANNQGLAIAKGNYILFINPDCIVSEDTFENMISFFESNPECRLAGCKILNSDGTLQLACRRSFPGPWTSFTKVTGLSNLFPTSKIFARYNFTYLNENKTFEVDAVSGSFMMLRKEVYEKVGGFDDQFFMYGEDLDLC